MVSLLSGGRRFVLLIGDEGAILLLMSGSTVRDRCFAPSPDPADRTEMEAMLAEAPRVPLLLLVDVLEQSFVKDTIPPVGFLDEASVLQRKLRTTFPDARIRGAKYLGRDKRSARKDKEYLFVSVPETKLISAWLEWARDVRNPVRAIALLPLESLTLATRLSERLHERGSRSDWVVLVTRHRTGGFRQIVVRKGELVFSRLTQNAPPDASPAEIAATIEREHRLTMGYLRRMSYNEEQGIDVIVLAQPEVRSELLRLGLPEHQLTVMTPHDVAASFGMRGVATPDDSYGEIVHGAWVARRRLALALMPEEIVHHRVGVMTTQLGYIATAAIAAYMSYGLVDAYLRGAALRDELSLLQAAVASSVAELNQAIQVRGGYSVSAPEVTDTIELFESLEAQMPTPLPILAVLASRIGGSVRASEYNWAVATTRAGGVDANLTIVYDILDVGDDVGRAMAVSFAVADQIALLLPGLDVEVTGPPLDVLPSQSLIGSIGVTGPADDGGVRSFNAEITIRVPVDLRGDLEFME